MSIAGVITSVVIHKPERCGKCGGSGLAENNWDCCDYCHGGTADNPVVRLILGPIRPGEVTGQSALTLMNPPSFNLDELSLLIGTRIWGNSTKIMIGERHWADRVSATKIELVKPADESPEPVVREEQRAPREDEILCRMLLVADDQVAAAKRWRNAASWWYPMVLLRSWIDLRLSEMLYEILFRSHARAVQNLKAEMEKSNVAEQSGGGV